MSKNGPETLERATGREAEVAAPDRAKNRTRTTQADQWVKDALDDDEVREALEPHHEVKHP
jgi:hypothetical protein